MRTGQAQWSHVEKQEVRRCFATSSGRDDKGRAVTHFKGEDGDGKILVRGSGRDDKGRGVTFRKVSDLDGQSYGRGKGPAASVY
jgi:hypothetical protein